MPAGLGLEHNQDKTATSLFDQADDAAGQFLILSRDGQAISQTVNDAQETPHEHEHIHEPLTAASLLAALAPHQSK